MKDIDPVEELHKIRRAICKKAGGTPADYFRYYLELDKKNIAASKAAEAAASSKLKVAESKSRRQPAKPRSKATVRKAAPRRKSVVQ